MMAVCWRCGAETEMPLSVSEGDTSVVLCDECMMAWLAGDFAIAPPETGGRDDMPAQPALF